MNKQEFNAELQSRLKDLPKEDRDKIVDYYNEMIDDRCEDGSSEDEAISALGSVDDIEAEVREGNVKAGKKSKRRLKTWELVLIIAGFPVWLPLLIAAFAVLLALYIVLWALCICIYAATLSCAVCGLFGVIASIAGMANGYAAGGALLLGMSLAAIGIAFLLMIASVYATKGMLRLTVIICRGIKRIFTGKENKK